MRGKSAQLGYLSFYVRSVNCQAQPNVADSHGDLDASRLRNHECSRLILTRFPWHNWSKLVRATKGRNVNQATVEHRLTKLSSS